MVLVGILFTMGVTSWMSTVNATAVRATKERQVAIQNALQAYLRANGRLPCPDIGPANVLTGPISGANTPDGRENRASLSGGEPDTTANCAQTFGFVPYVDLGLGRDAALDAWGNYILYRVSNVLPATAPLSDWVKKSTFKPGNRGTIQISDRVSAFPAIPPFVVVLISHGKNGAGAWTTRGTQMDASGAGADELENAAGCSTNQVCYSREITESAGATGGPIDDLVLGISADEFLGSLIRDGSLKSTASALNETFESMIDRLAFTAIQTLIPANPLATPPTPTYCTFTVSSISDADPWGQPINCALPSPITVTASGLLTAINPPPICIIVSKGPDGVTPSSDDIARSVTYSELASRLIRRGC